MNQPTHPCDCPVCQEAQRTGVKVAPHWPVGKDHCSKHGWYTLTAGCEGCGRDWEEYAAADEAALAEQPEFVGSVDDLIAYLERAK